MFLLSLDTPRACAPCGMVIPRGETVAVWVAGEAEGLVVTCTRCAENAVAPARPRAFPRRPAARSRVAA